MLSYVSELWKSQTTLGCRQNLEFISISIVLVLEGGDAVGSFCWKVPWGGTPNLGPFPLGRASDALLKTH